LQVRIRILQLVIGCGKIFSSDEQLFAIKHMTNKAPFPSADFADARRFSGFCRRSFASSVEKTDCLSTAQSRNFFIAEINFNGNFLAI
jgi:hypothetical protein